MELFLAQNLDELHEKYSQPHILEKVQLFFVILDSKVYNGKSLFVRAVRHHDGKNYRNVEKAEELWLEYQKTHRVPLIVARCLLPSKPS